MTLRCNICSIEIEENEVELHINTPQHLENKSKISLTGEGEGKSVAELWRQSIKK